jgi:arylsulfatase A-like enzyme
VNSLSGRGKSKVTEKPNIVFIMADDLGYGHLGCYGQKHIRTPQLDRMASEGIRFTQAYAGCSVCAPSRSVLMTGLHGGHSPVRGNSGGIPLHEEDVTVAEVLHSAGYRTGCFGKWGLGEHGTTGMPNKQGFDEFFGYLHQIHAHFYYPEYLWKNDEKYPLPGNSEGKQTQYTHDEMVEQALGFIRANRKERFFLYVPFAIPHYELLVPEDSLIEYRGKFPEKPYKGRGRKPGYPRDYGMQATPKAAIAGMITRMDRNIGRIMSLLDELGLNDNTVVFFTSDNGPSGGAGAPEFFEASGRLRGLKGSFYEGGIRVPFIALWPGKIKAGTVSEHVCYFADVMPTLAELGGVKGPSGIDGISIVRSLLGEAGQKEHEFLYWESKSRAAVRMGNYKAVRHRDKSLELYDLSKDPVESNDIASKEPEIVAKIEQYMKETRTVPRAQIEPKRPQGRKYQ